MTSVQGLNSQFLHSQHWPVVDLYQTAPGGATAWHPQETVRKPPQREGISVFDISNSRAFFQDNQIALSQDLTELKRSYGFPPDDSVATFLADHRSVSTVLLAAIPHLRDHFGADNIFNLEVSTDDDDSKTLYAVAVWRDTVPSAALALENFLEDWWLDHMTAAVADLAFTYEIS